MGLKAEGLAASRADGLVRYNEGLAHIEFLGQAAAMDGGVLACRLALIEGKGVVLFVIESSQTYEVYRASCLVLSNLDHHRSYRSRGGFYPATHACTSHPFEFPRLFSLLSHYSTIKSWVWQSLPISFFSSTMLHHRRALALNYQKAAQMIPASPRVALGSGTQLS